MTRRYWEIDTARGIAVLMMILFHTLFIVTFFGIADIEVSTGFWRWFAFATAGLFIFLAGLSLHISRSRGGPGKHGSMGFVLRGARIFSLGILITLVTAVLIPDRPVIYGILHFLGTAIAIGSVLPKTWWANLALGSWAIAGGMFVSMMEGPPWTLMLGLHPSTFTSLDYVPILPWIGVFLYGLAAGEGLYPGGIPRFSVPGPGNRLIDGLMLLGSHSLVIYLAHIPLVLLVLWILFPGFFSALVPSL